MSLSRKMDVEKAEPIGIVEKAAPVEQQQDTTTVAVIPTNNRCRRFLLGLAVVVTLISLALAIGLSVGLSIPSADDASTNTQSESNDLDVLCQQQDHEACRMACASAMCCFEMTATSSTSDCSIPKQQCGHYAPCFVLVDDEDETTTSKDTENNGGGASLPGSGVTSTGDALEEPTPTVREICNSGYMEVSNITCEEACWSANCCYWTGDDGCYNENQRVCDMWKDAGCFVFSDPFGADPEAEQEEGEP